MRWDAPKRERTVQPPTPWGVAVEAMIRHRRLAPSTATNVRENLVRGRLANFRVVHAIDTLDAMTAELARTFLEGIARTPDNPKGLAPATVRKVRQQLLWLGSWAEEELGHNPVTGPAMDRYRPPAPDRGISDEEPFSHADVERLVAAASVRSKRKQSDVGRDRLIVLLLATTGIRPSELVALNITSVRLDRRPPRIDVITGRREGMTKTPAGTRSVPLEVAGQSIVRDMRRYLEEQRPAAGSAALFLSKRTVDGEHTRLTQSGLTTILDRLGEKTGIHCNPYRFRHSVCTWLADAGLPEHALMTLMGWADRSMVDRYYRRRPERVLELVSRIRF